MKVDLGSIEVDDDTRRALRKRDGKEGLASRDEVRDWVRDTVADEEKQVLVQAFAPHVSERADG